MLRMAYNYTGVTATYVVPYGRTVEQHVHVYFVHKIVWPKVRQTCSQMLHGNDCPHIAMLVTTVFQEYDWEELNHPPYSLDLSLSHYNLFPKLAELLGICFSDLNELSLTVVREIRRLNKNQILHEIETLLEYWKACILWEGAYTEGM